MSGSSHKDNDTVPLKKTHDQDNVLYCETDLQPVKKLL